MNLTSIHPRIYWVLTVPDIVRHRGDTQIDTPLSLYKRGRQCQMSGWQVGNVRDGDGRLRRVGTSCARSENRLGGLVTRVRIHRSRLASAELAVRCCEISAYVS